MAGARYVTFGCGSQLAELLGRERQFGTSGYRILPLSTGSMAGGYGYTMWVQHVKPADMARWDYDPLRNTWTRR